MSIVINIKQEPYNKCFNNFYCYAIKAGYGYTNKDIQKAMEDEPYDAKLFAGPVLLLDCYRIEFQSSDDVTFFMLRWS